MRLVGSVLLLALVQAAGAAPAHRARPAAHPRKLVRPAPAPVAQDPYDRGMAEYAAMHWKEAVAAFDQLRAASPNDPRDRDVSYFIAIALAKEGIAFARVVDEWQRWLAAGSDDDPRMRAPVEANLGETLMAVGRLPEGIQHYRASDHLQPDQALTLFGLAVALDRNEQPDEAKRVMLRGLALDKAMAMLSAPEVFFIPMGDVHFYYGLGYEVGGKKDDAIREYQAFIAALPRSPYLNVARAHLARLQAPITSPI